MPQLPFVFATTEPAPAPKAAPEAKPAPSAPEPTPSLAAPPEVSAADEVPIALTEPAASNELVLEAPPDPEDARTAWRAARAEALVGDLNEPQREAVMHSEGPLLVLAGAGSGKTRALTRKIAWLVQIVGLAPWQILAVTFTNKAAAEMRERAAHLLGDRASDLWLGTFHSIGVRLLRQHGQHIGVPRGFVIHDDDDQETMIKRVLKRLNIDEKSLQPRVVRGFIDRAKQNCQGPDHPELPRDDFQDRRLAEVYGIYQQEMYKAGAVDFGDLIWLPYRLVSEVPAVANDLRLRFRYVLVDEFQDTNRAQYLLLKAILSSQRNLCAVGDDDQSIYRWRGAEVENILHFDDDFPGSRIIRFEQNYRSTHHILAVSGALIAQNRTRHGKTLFTQNEGGEKVRVFAAQTETDEADYVVRRIDALRGRHPIDEFAIIYRTNAQSRSFEDRLRSRGLNYKVYGGLRFYDRAEIKDIIAYLRLLQNPVDPVALERILNKPTRGIGATTLAKIEARARQDEISLWAALCAEAIDMPGGTGTKLAGFVQLITELNSFAKGSNALEVARAVLARTGYLEWLQKDGSIEGETRAENVRELLGAIGEFCDKKADNSLASWLDEAALASNMDQASDGKAIVLLTAHMAKGLEFDVVFVTGIEHELMPHFNSLEDPHALEEERRLAYVAMTRARHHLHLSHAASRRRFGQTRPALRSAFLDGLPAAHMHDENPAPRRQSFIERGSSAWAGGSSNDRPATRSMREPDYSDPTPDWENESQDRDQPRDDSAMRRHRVLGSPVLPAAGGWSRGMRAFHPQFGQGSVLDVEGAGDKAKVTVRFWDGQTRKLVAKVLSEL